MCGLPVARRPLPRPLLFQASALSGAVAQPREERLGISVPALGRVEPLTLSEPMEALSDASPALPELPARPTHELDLLDAFWPVVRMEAAEFAALATLNAFLVLVACLASGAGPSRLYGEFWGYLLVVHATLSWAFLMVPLVLVGQSPMMGILRLAVDTDQPERRMAFSLLYLVSATAFPLSFLCMVLTPDHRTLAELLSGREIQQMPYARMR